MAGTSQGDAGGRDRDLMQSLQRWVWLDDAGRPSPTDRIELESMRDALVKRQAPAALIEIALVVMVLSTVNFLLRPSYQPYFHLLDFAAALVMLGLGLWLRRPAVPARWAPWGFAVGAIALVAALLAQIWIEPVGGPAYVLIVLCIVGPVTLSWGPFLAASTVGTLATSLTAAQSADGDVFDWTFLAVTACVAGAFVLQLRMRSLRSEVIANSSLAQENQRMELVLESSRLGLWDWDMTSDRLVCDERWAEIFGHRLEDLEPITSRTMRDLIHPDDRARVDVMTHEHEQARIPSVDLEFRVRDRDGRWIWAHHRGTIVERAADGRPLRMTGTVEDISAEHLASERLAAAEEESRLAMENSAIGMCLVSTEGQFLRVNPALCRILKRPAGVLLESHLADLASASDQQDVARAVSRVASGLPSTLRLVRTYATADGHLIWGDTSMSAVRDDHGVVRHLVVQIVDVTEERNLRESLLEAQRIAHVGSWQLDLATGHMVWSEQLPELFGLGPDDPVPTYAESERLFSSGSWQRVKAAVSRLAEGGDPQEVEAHVIKPDGTSAWLQIRGEGVPDASGAIVALHGVALDITSRKVASDELRRMATHDSLTGLANRSSVNDEITLALQSGRRRGRTTAVLMIDLDHFKNVNDTLGHAAGDQLLVSAAARLVSLVRAGDLVSRTGGDEFIVVMRDLEDPVEALQAANRILEGFREPFDISPGGELFATASVGVATSSESSNAEDLVREADTAMYVSKEQGRDRASAFNEGLREIAATRLQVESDLRHALKRGELRVWYQPEIDLATGCMVAVEALLRWQHPDGTMWTADRFVNVAERTGLILDIGDWVLREACTQAAAWAADGPQSSLTVRVNVSALQLAEAGLLDAIDEALTFSGCDPALLCVEITETALLHQTATAVTNLAGIRRRGIRIAIDDFGTGYASLTYLREYPIDVLKIDRSFVTHIATDDRDTRIVDGIIALASALGLHVTAEGVENEDQARLLRSMGCPSAQGYLFSPGVPAEQIDARQRDVFPVG